MDDQGVFVLFSTSELMWHYVQDFEINDFLLLSKSVASWTGSCNCCYCHDHPTKAEPTNGGAIPGIS